MNIDVRQPTATFQVDLQADIRNTVFLYSLDLDWYQSAAVSVQWNTDWETEATHAASQLSKEHADIRTEQSEEQNLLVCCLSCTVQSQDGGGTRHRNISDFRPRLNYPCTTP